MVSFDDRVGQYTREAMLDAEARTVAAMASGAPIIYQATFFDGTFLGRADFLRRIETPSACWPWSYEVVDTKLALAPKAYFLLQLCNYSEHVARIQGTDPVHGHLVLGSGVEARSHDQRLRRVLPASEGAISRARRASGRRLPRGDRALLDLPLGQDVHRSAGSGRLPRYRRRYPRRAHRETREERHHDDRRAGCAGDESSVPSE